MQNHPFLVGLLATGSDKDNLFMLLELCTGGDLFSRLDTVDYFNDTDARFYIAQVLLGLETLHCGSTEGPSAGVDFYIHRDIKPENVRGASFGFLRVNRTTEFLIQLTATGTAWCRRLCHASRFWFYVPPHAPPAHLFTSWHDRVYGGCKDARLGKLANRAA